MPYLNKQALSQFLRTNCDRQLRFNLSPDNATYRAEREANEIPDVQPPRPGLQHFRQAGEEWEAEVLETLSQCFRDCVIGDYYQTRLGQTRYRPQDLIDVLPDATPGTFLIEMQFEVGDTFEQAIGIDDYRVEHSLAYARVRPDILVVLPAGSYNSAVLPSGDVEIILAGDQRLQLRIIDIKLSAVPSPSYFAEVAYYSMVLAGWLVDSDLDQQYVVVRDGAIWAGSHEASNLILINNKIINEGNSPTLEQLYEAMEVDLEIIPFEVFALRVRHFLLDDIPKVLSRPWQELAWHVNNRCKNCEYLGYPWVNREGQRTDLETHCMPMALEQDHLSRVAFLSRGASGALQEQDIRDVSTLAQTPADNQVYDSHYTLRATRTVISHRANSLQTNVPVIPPASGTSSVMPRWTDLHVYISVDYDLGSAITVSFGLQAFWLENRPFGSVNQSSRERQNWNDRVFTVDLRTIDAERRELFNFLREIYQILEFVRGRDQELGTHSSVQFYIWDSLQYEHLTKVIGRHLHAILNEGDLRFIAWLFPSEEILPNPRLSSRRSPVTVVKEVVRAVLAAPIPHYYSLFQIARVYHQSGLPEGIARFSTHPLFEDILSDQIPSERAHEIWTRTSRLGRTWQDTMRILRETVNKRLRALETVTRRIEQDLGANLGYTAPGINIGPPQPVHRASVDGQLWYTFAKLNEALNELEKHQIRAMPPHEREARFQSARLEQRLEGQEETDALAQFNLHPGPLRRVYRLRENSREVKLRESDFGCAISPEIESGFLDRSLSSLVYGTILENEYGHIRIPLENVLSVTVTAIYRDNRLIVLDLSEYWENLIIDLESNNILELSQNVIVDPTHRDFFTGKLKEALRSIGNPAVAHNNLYVRRALGLGTRRSRASAHTPAADVLWNARNLYDTRIERELDQVRTDLIENGYNLNDSQWTAWDDALSRRMQLIWGPPGTGKSLTARGIILGAVLEAYQQNRPIRILICTPTYRALDIILLNVYEMLSKLIDSAEWNLWRLRSYSRVQEPSIPDEIDVELNKRTPSPQVIGIRHNLRNRESIEIVGSTPHQVYNLLTMDAGSVQQELFDLILIDEASQMDVAHSILAFCSLANEGSIVLCGDPLQLPPIHQAEAPNGLESMVGSVYTFFADSQGIPSHMLNQNYRSNTTLVEFSHHAGYETELLSYSPDLKLNLIEPIPIERPDDWPDELFWTPEWSNLLNPDHPAVCYVYPDGRSSQWNQFEADAVASLVYLCHGRIASQLLNERDTNTGSIIIPESDSIYSENEFWNQAIGIVTPHRAQQGKIISRLLNIFASNSVPPTLIRGAVDTVERYQGQQRDIIIASFALGDPDAIFNEDKFLMSLNRFNVMASRARSKLIVFVSQEVVDHLSSDLDILRQSRLLKIYAESYCANMREMRLGYIEGDNQIEKNGYFRYL